MTIINVTAAQDIDTLLSERLHTDAAWRRHPDYRADTAGPGRD